MDDLLIFFASLLKKYNFPEAEIQKLAWKFTVTYFGNLMANAGLSESEQLEVNKLSEASKWNEILDLIKLKFANEQAWMEYCEKIFVSLMDEYFKQVVSS